MRRTARLLARRAGAGNGRIRLPGLLFFTDPVRTPDIAAVLRTLPRGSAVVFRHFGAPDAEKAARGLLRLSRAKGLKLLIGADPRLAARIGADGVHLAERQAHLAGPLRRAHPRWIVTSAAHSTRAVRGSDAQAVVMSAIFPSRSPSAGSPLGPTRLASLVRSTGRRVYALGGVSDRTAGRLWGTNVVGIAAVEGLADPKDRIRT